jgi:excisionase family DNA binding protein
MPNNFNPNVSQKSPYLTVSEVSKLLKVSGRTVYRWIRQSGLRCIHIRNITRISMSDLEEFLRQNTDNGGPDGDLQPSSPPEA